MKTKYTHIVLVAMSVFLLGMSACSTKKNTWTRRNYHNLAAHYNAYFNGKEALKKAKSDISLVHIDDYSEVLNVFQLATSDAAGASLPDLERAIQKASLVIYKHSMYFNKKEYVKWVYHSYMLIGQSHFYKHDYMQAQQSFQFVGSRYKIEDVRWDAMMWNAMTDIQQEEYDDARTQLDAVQNKVNQARTSKEVVKMLPMVYAELFIKQENYSAAVEPLTKAIEENRKKIVRSRLYFILGQVQGKLGNSAEAIAAYQKCIKLSPSYEMDFNARINMAKNFEAKSGSSDDIKRELLKMLKDPKNTEYQDQIYFALAEIELKEKNRSQAIGYLKESVRTSVKNDKQKAFSSLQLADMYFEDKSYQNSQAYYDSTVMFMPQDYPGYTDLVERKNILTELVTNLVTIQNQDSLQRIARMSEPKRNQLIQELIAAEIERERQEAEAERIRQQNMMNALQDRQEMESVTDRGPAKWYFYNPNAVAKGIAAFQNKWKERPLEDNWRISNKQSLNFGDDPEMMAEIDENDSLQKQEAQNKKTPEYYMKDLPLTQELMDSSNRMIENAYYALGLIYKEKLNNYDKAIKSFEDLLKRYDKTDFRPQTYYYLYQSYTIKDQPYDAKYYKELLLKNFPESDFAKILTDPDYYKKLEKESNKARDFYKDLYLQYQQGQLAEVAKQTQSAMEKFEMTTELKSQFALLNALAVGKSSDTLQFIAALEKVATDFPQTEVEELATAVALRLKSGMQKEEIGGDSLNPGGTGGTQGGAQSMQDPDQTIYVYNADETHMFLVVVDLSKHKLNNYKNSLDNHNKTYFAPDNLKISSIPLSRNMVMIGVSNFANKEKALAYYKTLKHNKSLHGYLVNTKGNYFVISDGNYARLYKSKDVETYKKFYKKYYN